MHVSGVLSLTPKINYHFTMGAFWILASLVVLRNGFCKAVTVDTEYGPVEGHVTPVFNGIGTVDIDVFLAVPYAQSTAGDNRFRVRNITVPGSVRRFYSYLYASV